MVKKIRTFMNDADGFSTRDYLLVISTMVFFGFVSVGLIMVLIGKDMSTMYIDILNMVDAPLMTIIAGVMGVSGIQVIADSKKEQNVEYRTKSPTRPDDEECDI